MEQISIRSVAVSIVCALALLWAEPQAQSATNPVYVQTNLVSDIAGFAQTTDPNLKNPWGVSFSATGPFWVSDTATNLSTLYQGTGSTVNARVVIVPGGPTGEIQNSTRDFVEKNGSPASFIFASLDGGIYTWNATDNTASPQVALVKGASFTGLAFASNSSGNFLYAANINGTGSIEVFNGSFAHVTLAGSFQDPNLPPGSAVFGPAYVPYNVQTINGQLYVEYANFKTGQGAVSVFDTNGNFIREAVAAGTPQLNLPWGVAIAPANFGAFSNDLLIGNLGNGQINAFDPTSGAFLGTLADFNGPLVNSGLWALCVRTGGTYITNGVYLTAGINNQTDGLLAVITPVTQTTVAFTTPTQLPAAKIGAAYTQALDVTGGAPGYSNFKIVNGTLPPGVTLNAQTGTLSGTPVGVSGTFSFTVSVADTANTAGFGSFQVTVQPAATTAQLARVGSFGQLAAGGGWKTTMTLINISATTVNAQINLYADNGNPLSLAMTFPEFGATMTASSVNVTLTPNDSVVIQTGGSAGAVAVGWADVQASGPLSGYATFAATPAGGVPSEGTVNLDTRLSNSLVLPYDNTNGDQTALAIANQSGTAQAVTVTLFDQAGTQVTSTKMNLPAFGHSSFFVPSQFTQAANQLGIIQFQSAAGLTGIGLRFSPAGTFTSIPIIR